MNEGKGVRAMGKLMCCEDVAYLLRAASLHDADRMADKRRRCQRKHVSKAGQRGGAERRGMYRYHACDNPCRR